MLPEVRAIAEMRTEARLLIELAKSANTRNLVGTTITVESDGLTLVRAMSVGRGDEALKKRLDQGPTHLDRDCRARLKPGDGLIANASISRRPDA